MISHSTEMTYPNRDYWYQQAVSKPITPRTNATEAIDLVPACAAGDRVSGV
jgi:hypothetical protein